MLSMAAWPATCCLDGLTATKFRGFITLRGKYLSRQQTKHVADGDLDIIH